MPPLVLALVNDLFFYSKVRQTAQQLGLDLKPADFENLSAKSREHGPQTVLIELGSSLEATLEAVRVLKSEPAAPRVVAFGSHVQTDTLQAARDAGCDEVYARSEFTVRLPEILRGKTA